MADFEIEADSEYIKIDGFTFAPAEADDVKAAISFAGGMREFPALPPGIPYGSFSVAFHEDGTLALTRTGQNDPKLVFSFDTVDKLIVAISDASLMSIDKKRHSPSPRHAGSLDMFNSGDVIEGKW
jgi:hypothetical protein